MNLIASILNWKRCNIATLLVLTILVVLNFYGVYTNKFYFTKPDNYIFPLLSLVHFLYLYVIWFKITEDELPDPKMRNLEYALYAVMVVYLFKIYDSAMIIGSISDYQEHVIPSTFLPIGVLILVLYCLLFLLSLLSFWHRKRHIGVYNFENFNDNLNMWQ
ncbi:hypothetical protein [Flagellimonas allohymeniacidonis]|uniref:Uncharacterized protein n=1 Tax=Flagellimonas allohymeniacidonis TaxID=2517819 RepID=A0A4Q8QJT4_9FLAO|nr:hypothetical protein [Allomuricauda hymeniacidonis]TAI48759.1 hypothetical protein EW142_02870 [Allomuricauda hymeniacidonis]